MKKAIIIGERKTEIIEVATPKAVNNWAVVKIMSAPMCAEYKSFLEGTPSNFLGHEAAGEVVEVAQNASVKVGDRVVVMPQYPCGECEYCISGNYINCQKNYKVSSYTGCIEGTATYAQYLIKPDWLLEKIPDGMSYDVASLACCGIGPSFGAIEEMRLTAFDTILITGLGPVGIGAIINAKYIGAKIIAVDSAFYRMNLAKEMGVEIVIDPNDPDILAKIKSYTNGRGVDYALDCSGVPQAQRLCIDAVRRRGMVGFIGECNKDTIIHVSNDLIRKCIHIFGSWHYNKNSYPKIMQVIENSPLIDKLISHTFPLTKIQEAFELASTPNRVKIILHPWDEE